MGQSPEQGITIRLLVLLLVEWMRRCGRRDVLVAAKEAERRAREAGEQELAQLRAELERLRGES